PERLLDAGDRRHPDHADTPERLAIHLLIKMLYPRRVFTNQHRREILYRADHAPCLPFQRSFAPAEQAGHVALDFDEHALAHPGVDYDGFDGGDFHDNFRSNVLWAAVRGSEYYFDLAIGASSSFEFHARTVSRAVSPRICSRHNTSSSISRSSPGL